MTLQPLLTAPLAVQVHIAAALTATGLGAWLIWFSRKGSPTHRALGVAFLSLMTAACLAGLFIHGKTPGPLPFGLRPTHLLTPLVLFMIWLSIHAIRRGQVKLHRHCVVGLFMGALIGNGVVNVVTLHGVLRPMLAPEAHGDRT